MITSVRSISQGFRPVLWTKQTSFCIGDIVWLWNLKLMKFTLVVIPTPAYCTGIHVANFLAFEPSYGFVRLGYFAYEVTISGDMHAEHLLSIPISFESLSNLP